MADNEERQDRPGRERANQGGEPNETRAFGPQADETGRLGGPEETARFAPGGAAPPDRTAQMPPVGPQPGEPRAWSGRASVPPVGPPVRETTAVEWGPGEAPPSRAWWLPILVGIVALLLLAVLGYGLWLIANSRDEVPVTPSPSPSAVPSPSVQTPTSAAPTTESPSPTRPERVEVPEVVDLPLPVARAALEQAGLRYRVEYRESDRPAGRVLESNPESGEEVQPGSEVTLIVAESPDNPPTTPPATDTPGPTLTG
jgi:PASTA domain